jgi:dimethylaniline monooxygenase (N-oxide forming)
MKIAIIGAGFAGLSSARVLAGLQHDVTVFESEPEVGGVWASSRRYPGLCTQNPGCTYYLSELPMPEHYPEWPSGEQVQKYMEGYVDKFGLRHLFQFNSRADSARYDESEGAWLLTVSSRSADEVEMSTQHRFDFLVIGNGIFSRPMIPEYEGAEEWKAAGGRILHTSELTNVEDARDKDTLVIGYGKSSCDAAKALAEVSRSTTVVARSIIWKIPRRLAGVLNIKHLLFTRLGEGLFEWATLKGFDRFIHGFGKPLRNLVLSSMQSVIQAQLKLKQLGLLPNKPFESVGRHSISLSTEGFFEAVENGKIKVLRETQIRRLLLGKAELANGDVVPADFIVAGTSFHQSVPLLSESLMSRITSENGDFRLYRGIVPVDVPKLAFIGYNSTLMCQLSCETSAMWLAEYIRGGLKLPSRNGMNEQVDKRLEYHRDRMDGSYFRGTYLVPFFIRPVDELLDDIDLNLSRMAKFKQWLGYIRPSVYARNYKILAQRSGLNECRVLRPKDSTV